MWKRTIFWASVLSLVSGANSVAQEGSKTKPEPEEINVEGEFTDDHCGCSHEQKGKKVDPEECTKACVHKKRAKYSFCGRGKLYVIDNQEAAEAYAGKKVKLKGTAAGNTISIVSVELLPEQKGVEWAKGRGKEKSWTGWITDDRCGAKGANPAHADCLKKCIEAGEKYALYVPATKKLYKLEPQDKVAEHGAHHVRVKGTVEGDTIQVASVSMVGSL